MTEPTDGIVVAPGEGKQYGRAGAWTLTTKAGNDDTRGAYTCQEMTVAPEFPGVRLHVHHNEDEAMYVLAGEVTARVGEQTHVLGAGAFILMPREVPHSFANPSPTEARVLVINSPGDVEEYFEETAELAKANGGQLDMQKQVELAKKYGIEFVL